MGATYARAEVRKEVAIVLLPEAATDSLSGYSELVAIPTDQWECGLVVLHWPW